MTRCEDECSCSLIRILFTVGIPFAKSGTVPSNGRPFASASNYCSAHTRHNALVRSSPSPRPPPTPQRALKRYRSPRSGPLASARRASASARCFSSKGTISFCLNQSAVTMIRSFRCSGHHPAWVHQRVRLWLPPPYAVRSRPAIAH